MKQYLAFILLLKCLILSTAEVSVEGLHHPLIKILSVIPTSKNIVAFNAANFEFDIKSVEEISYILRETQVNYNERTEYNELADEVITALSKELLNGGLDPAELNDQEITFTYKPLLITYTGTLSFTRGYIQDLSTVSRDGEVLVTYSLNTNTYKIEVPLTFKYIIAEYNFEMSVRGDTVSGVVYAWANDVTAEYIIELSGNTFQPTSKSFALNIGSITIELYSSDFDSYKSLLSELVEEVMQDVVFDKTSSIVGGLLDEAVSSLFVSV